MDVVLLLPFHHNFNTAIQEIVILENTMLTKTKPMTSQHQKVTQDIIVFSTITITSHCMKELGTLALIIPSHHNINPITLHSHGHQLISDRFCVFSLYIRHATSTRDDNFPEFSIFQWKELRFGRWFENKSLAKIKF